MHQSTKYLDIFDCQWTVNTLNSVCVGGVCVWGCPVNIGKYLSLGQEVYFAMLQIEREVKHR